MSDFTEEVVGTLYDNSQPAGLELNLRTPDNPFDAPVSVVVTRDGYNPKVHDLQEFLPYVRRRSGTVAFFDPASWVSYVQRYWVGDESAIFAGDTQIIAVLNHHPSETPGGRNDWRAVLQLRETPEWQAWSQGAGKWVTQEELANFLELHATDVLSPTAAEVLEAVLDVRAHLSATFRKGINLRNGTIQLEYVEELTDRGAANQTAGEIKIPAKLRLKLRRWQGKFEPVELEALIRFVLREGNLKLMYVFPATVAQAALEQWEKVIEDTGALLGEDKPILLGELVS